MEETSIVQAETTQGITVNNFNEGVFTTADRESESGKKSILKALNNAGSLAEIGDEPIKVTDVVITPGIRKARAVGQVDTPCVNVYLVTLEGEAYMTQSDGIARSVQNILTLYPLFGRSTPAGYLEVQVVSRVLPNGNTLKSLETL